MRVYLTEKQSQAVALAKALGGSTRGHPFKVPDGLVTWASGHLLELVAPDAYSAEWRTWSTDNLPMLPERWRKRPSNKSQLARVTSVLKQASEIVIATDAGREGELIAREIIGAAGIKVPLLRLWATALNATSLRNAAANLRPGADTAGLYEAGILRQRADWLEGLNFTRLLSLLCLAPLAPMGTVLSAGRVQTPALAEIVRRQREIDSFQVSTYYELQAQVAVPGAPTPLQMMHAPAASARITERAEADRRRQQATGITAALTHERKSQRRGPPPPFELASLQGLASTRKGWTAARTLEVAQALYETHQAITYPRTDGAAFDPTEWDTCLEVLGHLGETEPSLRACIPAKPLQRPTVFNARALEGEDHDAIKPTAGAPPMAGFNADEAWLYERIARRFVAQFLPDWEFDITDFALDANQVPFRARARVTTAPGWKIIDQPPPESTRNKDGTTKAEIAEIADIDPAFLAPGVQGTAREVTVLTKQTKPPAAYNDGSLIRVMKRLGIGTKATRHTTADVLRRRGYVEMIKRRFKPTRTGTRLIEILEEHLPALTDAATTARLEALLDDVQHGRARRTDVEDQIRTHVRTTVDKLRGTPLPTVPAPATPPARKGPARATGKPRRRRTRKARQ